MKNQDYRNQSQAYLQGAMNRRERLAFESALEQQEALRETFLKEALSMDKTAFEQEGKWKEMLDKIRREKGSLPEPRLNFFDRLRFAFFYYGPWKTSFGLLFTLLAGMMIVANLTQEPAGKLIQRYFIEAYCYGYAGEAPSPTNPEEGVKVASGFYCGNTEGGVDSLKALADGCAGFCMADYYLAHWQLKNGQFEQAIAGFEQCLANEGILPQVSYTSLAGPVQLNLQLANLGAGHSRQEILAGLQALVEDSDAGDEARRAAQSLHNDLSHPLRFLAVR